MGTFLRQRLISHLSRGQPGLRVLTRGNVNASTAAGYATSSESEDPNSSWFQKLKGVFKGKSSSETLPQASEPKASESKATLPGDFTMESKAMYFCFLINLQTPV